MKTLETLKRVREELAQCELTPEFGGMAIDLEETWPTIGGVISGRMARDLGEVVVAMTDMRTGMLLAVEMFDEADAAFEEQFGNINPWRELPAAEKFIAICERHGLRL